MHYDFDVKPRVPAPIYVLTRQGRPVRDQLNAAGGGDGADNAAFATVRDLATAEAAATADDAVIVNSPIAAIEDTSAARVRISFGSRSE